MPYYDYRCSANGRTIEVRHGMDERIETWGQLAQRAGVSPGDTPADAPVAKLMSAPVPLTDGGREQSFGGCGTGCACVPQG